MKKALLIGINYTSIPNISLQGCIDDVVNMKELLIDVYGYAATDIVMLNDVEEGDSSKPTKENIIKAFAMLASESSSLDEIWVHYSGHGSQIYNQNSDQDEKLDSILVPLDYESEGYISEQDLLSYLQKFTCRSILIFDCCHSGTMCDLPYVMEYIAPNRFTKKINTNAKMSNMDIYVFSACRDSQTAADTFSEALQEPVGAFTASFIKQVKSKLQYNILTLYNDICMDLQASNYKQAPVLSTSSANVYYTMVHNSVAILPTKPAILTTQPVVLPTQPQVVRPQVRARSRMSMF
uniref:Peptidase C14 caspase domain-containing protein n=1 Tax=viral metagenome TaxID=1070528 RepID=A0A6C0I5D1_9ZZZZ